MKSLLCLLLTTIAAFAQLEEPWLSVKIVPETPAIVPGKPFTVALKMKHIEHGHSYWINSGATGSATKVIWTLPPGFTAAEPQWPAPIKADSAGLVGYLYEGETLPLVTITAPATLKAGDSVNLDLLLDALVCTTTCRPTKAKAKLTIPVADAPGAADAETQALFTKARAAIPAPPKSWAFSVAKQGKDLALTLKPEAGANTKLTKAYFFSATTTFPSADVDPEKPQELKKDGDHWILTLPIVESDATIPDPVKGVLQAEEGWLEGDSAVKNFAIELKLGAAAKASAAAGEKPATPGSTSATTAASGSSGNLQNYGTATLLLFAFIGGLILNIMPCVFPVIGIKIVGFVQQAGGDKRQIFMHGLAYTAGVLVCFWALALIVMSLRLGWGAQLQNPTVVFGLAAFFTVFALNMAGVFEIGTSAVGIGQELQAKQGLQGSFFSGLLATVVATPCSAPFLGPALAFALSLSKPQALGVFTVIGLGLSSPYLVLSLAPGLVKLLPRPGDWMVSFKQAMSFLLFGTVGFLLWVLDPQLRSDFGFLYAIFGVVLIALACWIYGRWCLPHKTASTQRIAMGVAAIALAGGLWLGWPETTSAAEQPANAITWKPWSPETVKELRAAGKPVYIDFTARWCATCQVNKRVYHNQAVEDLIRSKGIQLLKADWTNNDQRITDTLRDEYQKSAVPVNVLYAPGSDKPLILPELLTVENVSAAFNSIK